MIFLRRREQHGRRKLPSFTPNITQFVCTDLLKTVCQMKRLYQIPTD
ncbi:hypothetical protein OK016_01565 [Vibrio chagasii]|nr:hypothetical protein [Vibrio chagasii]